MTRKESKRKRAETENAERAAAEQAPALHPDARRGIGIILIFAIGIICAFGLFNQAGAIGGLLNTGLKQLFGWGRYGVPVLLFIWGYVLLRPKSFALTSTNYVGATIFVFSFSALMHVFLPLADSLGAIPDGRGGGYLGYIISAPFRSVMGFAAALVVILALCLISLLIMTNTSLERLNRSRQGWINLGWRLRSWRQRIPDDETETGVEPEQPADDASDDELLAMKRSEVGDHAATPDNHRDNAADETTPVRRKRRAGFPIDLLETKSAQPTSGDITGNMEKIRTTLENFGIPVEMGEVKVGPTVTQYTFRPSEGVKVAQITGLSNDLALALAAHPIRIEAPIPGKSLVGIEVPNQRIAIVGLRGLLESAEFKKRTGTLWIALGRDVAGTPITANLETMPHLLIAGATGSGKSVCIHTIIASLLFQNSPDTLQFIMVDPKKVELISYNDVPHLLTPVITETDKTINALKWLVGEMDRRYHVLAEASKKNIAQYNTSVLINQLPYIVVIIDELADLMVTSSQEVESIIIRLAQMARAVGIHLIVSTQRPSVDVITGLIKANITSRIAFSVASLMDSRTILDYSGAEKLLGRGDMLYTSAELSKPRRIQGALVTEPEIERVSDFLKKQSGPAYKAEVTEKQASASVNGYGDELGEDDLLESAKEVIWQADKASASLLQRRLRIGYARAARILDLLEQEGVIGPGDGAKPREVLISHAPSEPAEAESVDVSDDEPPAA